MRKSIIVTCLLGALSVTPAFGDDISDIQRLIQTGKYTDALKKTDKILAQHPNDAQYRFFKGTILAEQNKTAEAIAIFVKLSEDFPDLPEPYNNLAVLYASQNDYDKARLALDLALKTNPIYATAQRNLSDIYATLAHQAYDKALDMTNHQDQQQPKLLLVNTLHGNVTGGKLPPLAQASIEKLKSQPKEQETPAVSNPTIVITKPAEESKPPVANKPTEKPVETPKAPEKPAEPKPETKPAQEAAKAPEQAATPKPPVIEAPKADAASKPAAEEKAVTKKPTEDNTAAKDKQTIIAEVNAWAKAWSKQDVAGYLGYYAPTFKIPGGATRKTWESTRRDRITEKKEITVTASKIRVEIKDKVANARFTQSYESNRLTANTRKTLVFNKIGNRWLITEEIVGR